MLNKGKTICFIMVICVLFIFNGSIVNAEDQSSIKNKIVPTKEKYCFILYQVDNTQMIVNGVSEDIVPGENVFPTISNERVFIPIRSLVEKLGGSVEWIGEENKILIKLNSNYIQMQLNSKKAFVNSHELVLDEEPVTINDRIMVPLRFVAENLGYKVKWIPENMIIAVGAEILQDTFESDNFFTEDLSLYDAVTKQSLYIGMPKADVEKILGLPSGKPSFGLYNYYGLSIFYRNEKIAGLIIQTNVNRYTTIRNVNFFSSKDYVLEKYGKSINDNDSNAAMFAFQKTNNLLAKLESMEKVNSLNKENIYIISFSFNKNSDNTVSSILIGDYAFISYYK